MGRVNYALPSPYLRDMIMNVNRLVYCLETYIDLQDLRKIGLSEEEIDGFIIFEWDSFIGKDLIELLVEGANDKH